MRRGLFGAGPEVVVIDRIGHRENRGAGSEGGSPVFNILLADGEDAAHHGTKEPEENPLGRELPGPARAILQRRVGPQKHGNAQQFCGGNGVKRAGHVISMHPHGVKSAAAKARKYPVVEGGRKTQAIALPDSGKEFMNVAVEKGNVPMDLNTAKPLILIPTHRQITEIEDGEFDVRLLRDSSQQGRLILDGVADKICDLHGDKASIMHTRPKLQNRGKLAPRRRKLIKKTFWGRLVEQYVERVVDLTDPDANQIYNFSIEEARERLLSGTPDSVRRIQGSFALLARKGKTVKMARSLDRPMRYFLAKRQAGPVLIVAPRIDVIYNWLKSEGLEAQFHPSYTRMVPAHYIVELQLIGCPDPDPVYTRFFTPVSGALSTNLDEIGKAYIGALAEEISLWLKRVPPQEPIGVFFSGGVDSGSVFLATYHVMRRHGMNPARLKAFVLDLGNGPDVQQARAFLDALNLGLFLEPIEATPSQLNPEDTIRIVEDYKSLDVESATMALALCRGIRERYAEWKYLLDGDGGDENLKDYPIEENPELTIRSVVNNQMLYQEGWGVGKIKHSLTYSGGLSRSYTRTYAPARHFGFSGFSPFTRPEVIAIAEAIPFIKLTDYSVERLYELKGEIVSRGIAAVTGMKMPVFQKRRFQHGAIPVDALRAKLPFREAEYRKQFLSLYL